MATGIILVLIGAALIIVPLLLAYRTIPGLKAAGSGVSVELQGEASRDLPRTPAVLRNSIVGLLVILGVATGGVGLKLTVDSAAVSNAERLARLRSGNESRLEDLARLAATPAASRTPVPGRTPIPNPPPGATQLLTTAVRADAAGSRDQAILLYQQALSAGLPQPYSAAVSLQLGLLDLVAIEEGTSDPREKTARCARASRNLQTATASGDSDIRDAAQDAVKELARLCGGQDSNAVRFRSTPG